MGKVYRATDGRLNRNVALKFLPESLARDKTAQRRFLREARSAAALDHPYICQIHEISEAEDGTGFIAMEFVSGETLKGKLAQGILPIKESLRLAGEIADALLKAQETGIVHRDLKPANIMITSSGHVKVMDFGLAKRMDGGLEEEQEPLTREGTIVGTVPYMSPEQLKGETVDSRSDIFSFGVILYQMLSGVHPFIKPDVMATASAILQEEPIPVAMHREGISAVVQYMVRKMLAKDPQRRYQSVREVHTDLLTLQESGELAVVPGFETVSPPNPYGSWLLWLMIPLALVSAGIGWFARSPDRPQPAPPLRTEVNLPEGEYLEHNYWPGVAVAPNGKYLAYTVGSARVAWGPTFPNQILLRYLEEGEARAVIGGENAASLVFSPDSQWIAYYSWDQDGVYLKTLPIQGGISDTVKGVKENGDASLF